VRITELTRFVNDRLDKDAPETVRAKGGTNKQTLHLANSGTQFSQRDTAGEFVVFSREQQPAIWWRVLSGKAVQFLIEVLKTETDAEPRSVFFEESAGLLDVLLRVRREDVHLNSNRRQDRSRLLSEIIRRGKLTR